MNIEDVRRTYDDEYAATYDATHLFGEWNRASLEWQLSLLQELTTDARSWLDVACGTGWFLSQFPGVRRAGVDVSPAMLGVARERNPGVQLVEADYRAARPEWNDQWDLVSCMWWAYCLAESMAEIRQLVARMAEWTSPVGKVFLPLCNVQKFDRQRIHLPYVDPTVPGRIMITGITWTWIQENGKRHDDVVSPQVEHMVAMFREHFEDVTVVEGNLEAIGEGWRVQDVLIASRKRRVASPDEVLMVERTNRPAGPIIDATQ